MVAFIHLGAVCAQDALPKLGDRSPASVFGKPRLAVEDVIYFTNHDVLRGEVTSDAVHIMTPYSEVAIPFRMVAGISFEGSQTAGETVITVNSNRITGIVTDRFIKFRIGSAGADVPIRKEKIRSVILRRSALETANFRSLSSPKVFVMANGDQLSGEAVPSDLLVRTDYGEVSVPMSEISELDVQKDGSGNVQIQKSNGDHVTGLLQTDEISLSLEIGITLEAVFKDRFARIQEAGKEQRIPPPRDVSSSPTLDLPPMPEEPVGLLAPSPTDTPTRVAPPTLTPTPLPSPAVSNTYENETYRFAIERPSEKWRIITAPEELKGLNEDAVVAFQTEEGIYSMVLVEDLPGVSLDDYVDAVTPALENVKLVKDEKGRLTGLPARKREWQGTHNGLPFRFFYTLVAKGDQRLQIVSWIAESALTDALRQQINVMEDSFRPLDTSSVLPPRGTAGAKPPR
jgi:hypothetical protein